MFLNVFVLNVCVLNMSSNQRHKKMNMHIFQGPKSESFTHY